MEKKKKNKKKQSMGANLRHCRKGDSDWHFGRRAGGDGSKEDEFK
ncbi:hypothetical protein LINGRAHAP2_LOCUS35772, partial [Linum grandiflorum]